jgi:acyl transferase domain-containing protein/NADPH:quinone reductase-like Zn-dependent oxidoreductase
MADSSSTFLSCAKLALAIRRMRAERSDLSLLESEPIAIVGIGCRFPGGVQSGEDYWQLLHDGVDAITTIPPERWDADAYFDADSQAHGKTNSRYGGFVPHADLFDPLLFGIAPREAVCMDPQQRLLLEVVWEAIWNSGRAPESLAGSAAGVFIAIYNSDYSRLLFENAEAIGPNTTAGGSHSIASGRISFLLDLHGPCLSVDTACSSSLVALHAACQSLRAGECNVALAGGITLHLLPEHYIAMAKLGMLAPDGRCKTFDSKANGFVPGEGCGIVVLKPLVDALKDGDRIYSVIRGTAVNQDGRTNVLTAPNGLAQREVIRAALRNAQIPASSVSYIEAHGTGTALGDPIEVEALAEIVGANSPTSIPCALGAVKSNIGHLEAAAGVAGLIKAALALDREEIPPNLHFSELNHHITLEGTRFYFPTKPMAWPRGAQPRFAATSSFGFGGTNAHIVMEEAPQLPQRRASEDAPQREQFLLPISARTPEALQEFAGRYREFLNSESGQRIPLYDICHSAATRRHHYEERLTVRGGTRQELTQQLGDFLEGHSPDGVAAGRASQQTDGVVFLFSGQGSQWPRMGAQLYESEPVFRQAIEECDRLIRQNAGWSLVEQLLSAAENSKLNHTEFAQPAIFAVQVALARLWESWGIAPAAIIGHSAGEVAAAHVAGVLELEEAVRVVVHRGRLMESATGQGKMAAVRLPAAQVTERIAKFGDTISIAAINSPESTVISGNSQAVDQLTAELLREGVGCRILPVDYAFHSQQMDPYRAQLPQLLSAVRTNQQRVPIISTVTGTRMDGTQFGADYWGRNVRLPVLFAAAVEAARKMGLQTFLEVGPHPVLLSNVRECLDQNVRREELISSLQRNKNEAAAMLSSLGRLHALGCPVNWNSVYSAKAAPVSLPVYPYQRQRYWISRRAKPQANTLHPLLGACLRSPSIRGAAYQSEIDVAGLAYLADHRMDGSLLLPMTAFLEMAGRAVELAEGQRRSLVDIIIHNPLALSEDAASTVQTIVDDNKFQVFSPDGEGWKLHASGRWTDAPSAAGAKISTKPATDLTAIDVTQFYSGARRAGMEFGPSFCVLESLYAKAQESLGHIRLGERESREISHYRIHPALLDGCLQITLAAASRDLSEMYLPFSMERFESFRPPGAHAWARARVGKVSGNGETISADIDIFNEDGEVLARINGLRLKRRTARASTERKMYQVRWQASENAPQVNLQSRNWLVICDDASDGDKLAEVLRGRGFNAQLRMPGQTLDGIADIHGVARVFSRNAAETPEKAPCNAAVPVLSLVQEIVARFAAHPPRLCLVTKGAAAVEPSDHCDGFAQLPVWGMARTIASEHPELRCKTLDLDSANSDFTALAGELVAESAEEQIAFRQGKTYRARLEARFPADLESRRLTISARGSIDNLKSEPMQRREPSAGEVEVEVAASALNFRDLLGVLGMYPGDPGPLGLEFCGRVARVGSGVSEYVPGERVMGIAWGSFASFVNTPAALVARVPRHLSDARAVSIPNAFLTAYHCLVEVGKIKSGDRVLIHAATGGVGLAAVQIAQSVGAEIFATAGSQEKRDYLQKLGVPHVFSSRSLDFANKIPSLTGGQGVDLVLNSLAGDFLTASFAVLAEGGRFVEIGKNDTWSNERVQALGKSIQYSVVDLAPIINDAPERIQSEFAKICRNIEQNVFRPLPVTVFPFGEAAAAFRYMALARHMGKIVLRHPLALQIAPDATYLITGGLGAIGLFAAEWLTSRGARNLLLVGRKAPSAQAMEKINGMRAAGTRVEIRNVDVSKRADLEAMFKELGESLPPLRGVLHAAGIVDDGILQQQSAERFARVMAPKVSGAWNLHELTQTIPLDFFVLFSSIAAIAGSPSQSAYAAGNAYMDGLAQHRRSLGLPALSVNWGAWADAGMAARAAAQGNRHALSAIRPMSARDCFASLEMMIADGAAQVAIADVDWAAWKNPSPLLSELVKGARPLDVKIAEDSILDALESAPQASRRKVLVDYLRAEALRILGLSPTFFIDERQPLLKMGLDSLMAVEFRNRLAASLKRTLTATLLFDYPTIGELADHLNNSEAPAGKHVDPLLRELDEVSDREAEELLKQELDRIS